MKKPGAMEIQDGGHHNYESESDAAESSVHSRQSKSVTFSGPLSGPQKKNPSARFKDQNDYVEITLDVRDDTVSVQDIKGAVDEQEAALLTNQLEKQRGARRLTSQFSAKIKQVSRELKRVASSSSRGDFKTLDRTKTTAARALRGLQFINQTSVGSDNWAAVEKRFGQLSVDGLLLRSRFGQCIGGNFL